jgi:hypothetical protein
MAQLVRLGRSVGDALTSPVPGEEKAERGTYHVKREIKKEWLVLAVK